MSPSRGRGSREDGRICGALAITLYLLSHGAF